MRKHNWLLGGLLVGALALAGCSQATQDRTSGGGKQPDSTQDAWNVRVFLNTDNVPNIALFCVNRDDPMAIMSTLSGGDNGNNKAASFILAPQLDVSYCGGRAK